MRDFLLSRAAFPASSKTSAARYSRTEARYTGAPPVECPLTIVKQVRKKYLYSLLQCNEQNVNKCSSNLMTVKSLADCHTPPRRSAYFPFLRYLAIRPTGNCRPALVDLLTLLPFAGVVFARGAIVKEFDNQESEGESM
jgi:hypothetical protein